MIESMENRELKSKIVKHGSLVAKMEGAKVRQKILEESLIHLVGDNENTQLICNEITEVGQEISILQNEIIELEKNIDNELNDELNILKADKELIDNIVDSIVRTLMKKNKKK